MKKMIMTFVLLLGAVPLLAHHGTGISYEMDKPPIQIKGTITEFRWTNPHSQVFMDVKGADGKVVNWAIEGASPLNWAKLGFTRDMVKVGDEVTAFVHPSQIANNPVGVVAMFILPDGKEIGGAPAARGRQ
jgi:hypothetical protein